MTQVALGSPSISAPSEPALDLFVNRELSFLAFNERVLEEATDPAVPLLERLKFLAIVSANLDEFFMVRVAGLKQQLKSGVLEAGPDRMLPSEQLAVIAQKVSQQVSVQEEALLGDLVPALTREGIGILRVADLSADARSHVAARFERQLFPMLTPLAVDPGHPFPFLKNRSLNLAVHLLPEHSQDDAVPLLAVVQVPSMLPRFIDVSTPSQVQAERAASGTRAEADSRSEAQASWQVMVVLVEDVIRAHVVRLFPGMRIVECVPFRVIRNWDLSIDEDEQEDLLETVQKELRRRWRLDAVRLEIDVLASAPLVDRLRSALDLRPADVQQHKGPLALADLGQIIDRVGRSDLRDELFQPVLGPEFRDSDDIFATIARGDVLLHHPYESYEPVVELLEQAAVDPAVLAIKQTLYRTNRDSPILRSLVRAAEHGKQVTALVELKARFDEEINVEWARVLEESGVHVVYGMIGLKTHCKVTLVVRREHAAVRRYVHLGTGNYNEHTATIYSDLSFFTARQEVADDISALFNLLTGYADPPAWKKLVVAPLGLRKNLLDRIQSSERAAKNGRAAVITFKSNALIDAEIIRALCKASQNGVEVTLLIRGPCALRVGIPGMSDRITVRLVIDRFLEHSRIFYFSVDGAEDVFITSTDIMPRNFDRRIEVMLPIEDERLKRRVVDEILAIELKDNVKASVLQPDGTYQRQRPKEKKRPIRCQAEFIALARARASAAGGEKKPKKGKRDRKKRKRDASPAG